MAPSSQVKTTSEQTWLFLFIPALLYYIYSCNNSNDRYNIVPSSYSNYDDETTGETASTSILSKLQLSQPYRVVASSLKLAGSDVTTSEIEPLFRLASSTDNNDDVDRKWQLAYPLEAVIGLQPHQFHPPSSGPNRNYFFTASVWVHDEELGRGYLLLSDSLHSGTVWRWEVGGGPITIGRSLYLKDSGCRSRIWANCPLSKPGGGIRTVTHATDGDGTEGNEQELQQRDKDDSTSDTTTNGLLGSAGITVQSPKDSNHFQSGSLIVVERGERRIVRMETDGARTPLVLQVPALFVTDLDQEDSTATERLNDPGLLLYTPFGDLIFTDRRKMEDVTDSDNHAENDCSSGSGTGVAGLYRMNEVVNIPPLSFQSSRDAHAWTRVEENGSTDGAIHTDGPPLEAGTGAGRAIEILYNDGLESITGLALGTDMSTIFISGRKSIMIDDGEVETGVSVAECRMSKQYVIVKSSLDDDDDDDDDDDKVEVEDEEDDVILTTNQLHKDNEEADQHKEQQEKIKGRIPGLLDSKSTLFYDMTHFFTTDNIDSDDVGPAVVADKSGNVYATFPGGVAIIGSNGELLATVPFTTGTTATIHINDDNREKKSSNKESKSKDGMAVIVPNSITFGHDGYLYITSKDALMRMRVKSLPVDIPTDLIVPPKKKSHMYSA